MRRCETDLCQQFHQGRITALHVAYRVDGHQEEGVFACCAAIMIVALTSALTMPGSVAECPAPGMISMLASGQARASSQAF